MDLNLFLSFRIQDRENARWITDILETFRTKVFIFDRDGQGVENFETEIENQLGRCDAMTILFTGKMTGYMRYEVRRAMKLQKKIYVFRRDEQEYNQSELQSILGRITPIDWEQGEPILSPCVRLIERVCLDTGRPWRFKPVGDVGETYNYIPSAFDQRLGNYILDWEPRVVVVEGVSGVGKTRLLAAAVNTLANGQLRRNGASPFLGCVVQDTLKETLLKDTSWHYQFLRIVSHSSLLFKKWSPRQSDELRSSKEGDPLVAQFLEKLKQYTKQFDRRFLLVIDNAQRSVRDPLLLDFLQQVANDPDLSRVKIVLGTSRQLKLGSLETAQIELKEHAPAFIQTFIHTNLQRYVSSESPSLPHVRKVAEVFSRKLARATPRRIEHVLQKRYVGQPSIDWEEQIKAVSRETLFPDYKSYDELSGLLAGDPTAVKVLNALGVFGEPVPPDAMAPWKIRRSKATNIFGLLQNLFFGGSTISGLFSLSDEFAKIVCIALSTDPLRLQEQHLLAAEYYATLHPSKPPGLEVLKTPEVAAILNHAGHLLSGSRPDKAAQLLNKWDLQLCPSPGYLLRRGFAPLVEAQRIKLLECNLKPIDHWINLYQLGLCYIRLGKYGIAHAMLTRAAKVSERLKPSVTLNRRIHRNDPMGSALLYTGLALVAGGKVLLGLRHMLDALQHNKSRPLEGNNRGQIAALVENLWLNRDRTEWNLIVDQKWPENVPYGSQPAELAIANEYERAIDICSKEKDDRSTIWWQSRWFLFRHKTKRPSEKGQEDELWQLYKRAKDLLKDPLIAADVLCELAEENPARYREELEEALRDAVNGEDYRGQQNIRRLLQRVHGDASESESGESPRHS